MGSDGGKPGRSSGYFGKHPAEYDSRAYRATSEGCVGFGWRSYWRCDRNLSHDVIGSRKGTTQRPTGVCRVCTSFTCYGHTQEVVDGTRKDSITFFRAVLVANTGEPGHNMQILCFAG